MFPDRTTSLIVLICFALVLGISVYLWGHGNGKESGASALAVCSADKAALADALNEVNARAATAQKAAQEQQKRADAAVAGAAEDVKVYDKRINSIAVELEKAKRQPTCLAQLEAELCAPLH